MVEVREKKERKTHLLTARETSEKLVEAYFAKEGVKLAVRFQTDDCVRFLYKKNTKHPSAEMCCFNDGRIDCSLCADDSTTTFSVNLTMGDLDDMVKRVKEYVS